MPHTPLEFPGAQAMGKSMLSPPARVRAKGSACKQESKIYRSE